MTQKYKDRKLGPWTWFVILVITVAFQIYMILSTSHLWPDLLSLAIVAAIADVAAVIYITAHVMEIDAIVRKTAISALVAIHAGFILNIALHGAASRDVGNVARMRAEQIENQKREDQMMENQARRNKEVLAAAGQTLEKARRYSDSVTNQARRAGVEAPPPLRLRMPEIKAEDSGPQISEVTASTGQTSKSWMWWVFGGFIAALGLGIGSASAVLHAKTTDEDGNGIPDYIERMYRIRPDVVQARFPEFYAILSGQMTPPAPKRTPGMSPSPATARADYESKN